LFCKDSRNSKLNYLITIVFIVLGGTVRLPRLIGESKAKELIFTGRVLNNKQAAEIGLADYAVEQNENGDAAFVRAMELADEMQSQGPVALRMAKKSISKGIEVRFVKKTYFRINIYFLSKVMKIYG